MDEEKLRAEFTQVILEADYNQMTIEDLEEIATQIQIIQNVDQLKCTEKYQETI
jgi:hypothetical protein